MKYPEQVYDIARQCAADFSNVDDAVDSMEASIDEMPEAEDWHRQFRRDAYRAMICDFRHQSNVQTRRDSGQYGGPPKVTGGTDAASIARQHALHYIDYNMAGRRLGDITFAELPDLAKSFRANAKGNTFNARLCERVYEIKHAGREDAKVRELVAEKSIATIFRKVVAETGFTPQMAAV